MKKQSKNFEYLQFDDTKFVIVGLLLTAVIFPPLYMGVTIQEYLDAPFYHLSKSSLYAAALWFLLRYELIFLRKKYPKISQTIKRNVLIAIYGIVVTYLVCSTVGIILHYVYNALNIVRKENAFDLIYVAYAYMLAMSVFAIYEAIYFAGKYKRAVEDRERLKTMHVQTELDHLRNQINPHFLFNSLNTLMNLIPKDSDRAMTYLEKLSKFYRYSVNKKDDTTVSINTELKNAKIYADLLHERFGDNIEISFNDNFPDNWMILPMTLQLLIENAVKHNVVSKSKHLFIEVYPDLEGEYLVVKNNLQKKIQALNSTGMGLRNIRDRFSYLTDKIVKIKESEDEFEVSIPVIYSLVPA